MSIQIKSGKEIIDEFFDSIHRIPVVDPKITAILDQHHRNGKFTATHLSNALFKLREETPDDSH